MNFILLNKWILMLKIEQKSKMLNNSDFPTNGRTLISSRTHNLLSKQWNNLDVISRKTKVIFKSRNQTLANTSNHFLFVENSPIHQLFVYENTSTPTWLLIFWTNTSIIYWYKIFTFNLNTVFGFSIPHSTSAVYLWDQKNTSKGNKTDIIED